MDLLSPDYRPTEGVVRVVTTEPEGALLAVADDSWDVEDDDPTEGVRLALADVQRQVHDLALSLIDTTDWEARMAATYTLTDLAETMASLRIRLEFAL